MCNVAKKKQQQQQKNKQANKQKNKEQKKNPKHWCNNSKVNKTKYVTPTS